MKKLVALFVMMVSLIGFSSVCVSATDEELKLIRPLIYDAIEKSIAVEMKNVFAPKVADQMMEIFRTPIFQMRVVIPNIDPVLQSVPSSELRTGIISKKVELEFEKAGEKIGTILAEEWEKKFKTSPRASKK